MFYVYKDNFLSGWGLAPNGSYIISDMRLKRPEFTLFFEAKHWESIRFKNLEGVHIYYWKSDGNTYLCSLKESLGVLIVADKSKGTWNVDLWGVKG